MRILNHQVIDNVCFGRRFLFGIWYTTSMNFKQRVIAAVEAVPKGKVVSYGQVAAACGSPRAARQVGQVLRYLEWESPVPWWRVINNQGRISIKGNMYATPGLQKQLLQKEKVIVTNDMKIDIEVYRYHYKT